MIAGSAEHRIIRMSLTVLAMVSSIDIDEFRRIVDTAALSSPISQALQRNVEIDIDPRLESSVVATSSAIRVWEVDNPGT